MDKLQVFWVNSSALDSFQSGFKSGYGMEVALVELADDLSLNVDKDHASLLLLLGLSETVNHVAEA